MANYNHKTMEIELSREDKELFKECDAITFKHHRPDTLWTNPKRFWNWITNEKIDYDKSK